MNILKNKTVILIAFLAAVSITPAMAAWKGLSRDPQEKGTHRIMTCNIRITGLPEDAKKPGCTWEERREVCRDVILAQKPDIICLQEVIYDSNEYMKKELKGYTSFGFAGPEMDPFTEGYHFIGKNVIFFLTSKYEMLGAGCYWLSEEPLIGGTVSWGTTRARHCNYLRLRDKKTGEEFRIIDTHLDHKSDNARREQARMLAEEAAQYADDFPQIICGDFNSSISDGAAQTLHVAGWKDAYEWMGFPDRFSFHGFKGEKYTKKNTRIDFIYLHGKVKPVHCRMITEGVNGILPSDHYFVMADVKVGD
mgnify:FL=1